MNKFELITTRDYVPADRNFILATWLKGLYYGNDWFSLIEKNSYFKYYNMIVNNILDKPSTSIKIVCLKDDPEVILAYSVFEGNILHWVQTKSAWRNIGLAKLLVASTITTVTHLTRTGKTLLIRKGLAFNPFLL